MYRAIIIAISLFVCNAPLMVCSEQQRNQDHNTNEDQKVYFEIEYLHNPGQYKRFYLRYQPYDKSESKKIENYLCVHYGYLIMSPSDYYNLVDDNENRYGFDVKGNIVPEQQIGRAPLLFLHRNFYDDDTNLGYMIKSQTLWPLPIRINLTNGRIVQDSHDQQIKYDDSHIIRNSELLENQQSYDQYDKNSFFTVASKQKFFIAGSLLAIGIGLFAVKYLKKNNKNVPVTH